MSARVLVVDDQEPNRRLLHAKLAGEYYQVQFASSGAEALERVGVERPDIVLLDVMMPGLDGYEVCRRLKSNADTRDIPVVMVTALDERDSRIKALQAGAEDYLTKPIDDVQLFARVRNVMRMKPVLDELRARQASGQRSGTIPPEQPHEWEQDADALYIGADEGEAAQVRDALGSSYRVKMLSAAGVWAARPDLIVVSLADEAFDGLRVIAYIRAEEPTRRLALLAIAAGEDKARALRALDLGADDLVFLPLDHEEVRARARTLVRRKRHLEAMSAALDEGLEAAAIDPLTGLVNRRGLESRLTPLVRRGGPLSLLVVDVDWFKAVNDEHGHGVGDALLCAFAGRLSALVRPLDIVCRYGGEEFVIVMPGTPGDLAVLAAERLRKRIAGEPFPVGPHLTLAATASFGVAALREGEDGGALVSRADEALYRAKAGGRNRVCSAR